MNKLTIDDIKAKKTSDTIFVLGSGYSVNKVKEEEWDIIKKHNSIAFNWFCKHPFEPTYFLIREQANLPSRVARGETVKDLIKLTNKYKDTVGIISDVRKHTRTSYRYAHDSRMQLPCLVVKDDNSKRFKKIKNMRCDPTKTGLIHGTCTIYNVMHLALFLDYKKIVFVGIDLYDSRYFWLKKNKTRHTVKKKKKKFKDRHAIASRTIKFIRKFGKETVLELYVTNPKSLLKRAIPYKSIGDFA